MSIKVITKDDKKGKCQSWSAEIDPMDIAAGGVHVNAGYGRTEEEAVAKLKENIREIHIKFSSIVGEALINLTK